jgi:hypothetical protein
MLKWLSPWMAAFAGVLVIALNNADERGRRRRIHGAAVSALRNILMNDSVSEEVKARVRRDYEELVEAMATSELYAEQRAPRSGERRMPGSHLT